MIGIVAEYNPFHEGHKYHVDQSTDGCVVAVMSGDFVQRGEAAIFDKYSRAAQACRNGVNIVVELPLPWCVSSAEIFAKGAVSILERFGVDKISFGSECGDINQLYQLSKINACSLETIKEKMRDHPELSFPAARKMVLKSELLDYPNNSLGIEYLKFATVPCMTIERTTVHDGFHSAKDMREEMKKMGIGVNYTVLETAIISRLISHNKEYFNTLPESENGLGNRLYEAVRKGKNLEEIYNFTKTKSVTMSAVRRLVLCAALEIDRSFYNKVPPYARILAFDSIGRKALHRSRDIPTITNGSEILKLDSSSQMVFSLCSSANDLYSMAINNGNEFSCGNDYRRNAIVI